jgi:hypothetical protein
MSVKLSTVSDGITKMLKGMRQRERALQSFLNKNVLEQYRNIQRKRWMSENLSESGIKWTRLNAAYARRKRKQYAAYEGGGTKMLIATGKLYKSVIGPGDGFRKITTPRTLYLATTVDYARFVDEARSFTEYSPESVREIRLSVAKFVFKGILKQSAEIL